MARFIHIGDLHLHKNNESEDNRNCVALVCNIINRYPGNSQNEKPIVMLTGDIVDDGDERQYKNAVGILRPLVKNNFKVIACPGNHDYGWAGNEYTEDSQRHFQEYILGDLLNIKEGKEYPKTKMEDIYPRAELIDNTLFIGLDSVVGNEDERGHFASGEVGKEQRKKLDNILKTNVGSGKAVVVYFHHHPFCFDNYLHKLVHELDDAKEVMKLLSSRVDIVCFGHEHVSRTWYGEYNIECIIAAGKTSSVNRRKKLQYRKVRIDPIGNDNIVSMITFKPTVSDS